MDPFAPIDLYCERTAQGFWAEPLNFLTNAAFLAAAWLAWRELRSGDGQKPPWELRVLIGLAALIGLGSGLFHGLANAWSQLADVLPIGVFLVFYLVVYLRRLCRLTWRETGGWLLAFALVTAAFAVFVPGEAVNGSQNYFGSCLALFVMTRYGRRRGIREANLYAIAAFTFVLSLIFRSVDLYFCPSFGIGTHFLWHLLNGFVIYLALRIAVRNAERLRPLPRRA